MVSPLGLTVQESWANALAGRSGITPIEHFDTSAFSTRIGGSVKNFDPAEYLPAKDIKKMDAFIHYGIAAAVQAIRDAGLEVTEENAERIGVAIGSGIGGLPAIERNYAAYAQGGPRKISPFFVPSAIINMIAGNLSIMYGFKGPNIAIVSACTTGTHNIGDAGRIIAYGDADVMIAGGAEMATSPLGLGGFGSARALSTRNDDPAGASRPWDRDRDGFVLSDGGGVVVLEEYEHARARGANIYAELVGFGMSGDAYHMTLPPAEGEGASACMRNALRDARMNPDAVDYINAHGTSTPMNDRSESAAAKAVFGAQVGNVAVSSTKSVTGHLIAAAGALEAAVCVLTIHHGRIPVNANLRDLDPECAHLDIVRERPRERRVRIALSNSLGFGGSNSCLVMRAPEENA
jgi:3-oxoacyl-[acyl-carrier-protein] synthase II